jgi:acetyl esterase/lipase
VARRLNSLGVHAFVLSYRVAPYRHPYPLLDAQRAIRTVRNLAERWGVDRRRVGMLGFSAGGHLAATAGTHFDAGDAQAADPVERASCRPDLLVLCYAVITFQGPFRHEGSLRNLLGDNPPEELQLLLSNERQVNAETPPTFLWHTAEDAGVPPGNSLLFASALARHKVPFELHIFPQGRHGLGLAPDDPRVGAWTGLCATWLKERGFSTAGPRGAGALLYSA